MRKITLFWLLLLWQHILYAQKEDHNWHFGRQVAVSFVTGAPVVQATTAMLTYEASSSISDATGQLLFYSNGQQVWNRNHLLMPNGAAVSATGYSSTQGALIVPHPGDPTLYYLFLTDEVENQLARGFRYVLVDMKLAGGLGDVSGSPVRLSTPTLTSKVTEKLTAIRHANGRDYWIVVHGWGNNSFYSFLLTATGLVPAPVVSAVGPVHDDTGGQNAYSNAIGYLRASPNGRHLATVCRDKNFELYDFDPATGQVANYQDLPPPAIGQPYRYGIEFSADNSRLYCAISAPDLNFSILQFNLLAGSSGAIASSRQIVGTGRTGGAALLRAPNGRIYMAGNAYLHAINSPNTLGPGCNFQLNTLFLNGAVTGYNLPNMPNAYSGSNFVQFSAPPTCLGSATVFTGQTTLPGTVATATWNFGDPASGTANTASGLNATHTYTAPGTYTASLVATVSGNAIPMVATQQVVVRPVPTVSLGASVRQTCIVTPVTLSVSPQPAGSTYRWQDGSTESTFTAQTAGTYTVAVTTEGGCTSQAAVRVEVADCSVVVPNIITPNGDRSNETFRLKGLTAADWQLQIYNRWGRQVYQQARYDNSWNAANEPAGIYYYQLRNTQTGQEYKGWVEVVR